MTRVRIERIENMSFKSIQQIIKKSEEYHLNFYEAVLKEDCEDRHVTIEESKKMMEAMLDAMLESDASYDSSLRSTSGLVGGDAQKMSDARKAKILYSDEFYALAIERAIKTGENNACMKRIVAAPTAGSSGVVPAVILTLLELGHFSREEIIEALYVMAGIGQVLATRAFISGAEGGCQAEVGSASAMAAGALAYLKTKDNEKIAGAISNAIKNLLGLVCDPIAGLVEVPCIKRCVIGAVNAISAADMAIAGVSNPIPVDEVIDAMRSVGIKMDSSLRETGEGGLAATPTGEKVKESLGKY